MSILLIGPSPPPIGGTSVSFACLADMLAVNRETGLQLVDTTGVRGKGLRGMARFVLILRQIVHSSRRVDVVTLHCSTTGLPIMGPVVLLTSRILAKPLIIRQFGGSDHADALGLVGRRIARLVVEQADLFLVQTNHLASVWRARGLRNVRWFPNYRQIPPSTEIDAGCERQTSCRRFVYVGDVREAKGIRVLAQAARLIPGGLTVDIYGRWFDDLDQRIFDGVSTVSYKGPLEPDQVVSALRTYDAFVFPTHYDGEGHPGAIIEAYVAGLPVIATRWMAIPEIVDESVGILVQPKSAAGLATAMIKLSNDNQLFRRLRANTQAKVRFFSAKRRAEQFVRLCREVIECNLPSG